MSYEVEVLFNDGSTTYIGCDDWDYVMDEIGNPFGVFEIFCVENADYAGQRIVIPVSNVKMWHCKKLKDQSKESKE
jgi:hypothetical protein